jgi:hypothetical protein
MKKILLLAALLGVGIFPPLHAGERKGLFMSVGLGAGLTSVFSETLSGDQTTTKLGPALSFRWGYAPTQRLQISMGFTGSMFQPDRFKDLWKREYAPLFPIFVPINFTRSSHTMFELLGARYYFSAASPSFMVGGGIGVSAYYEPFWDETGGGVGFWVEGGYEFAKHFSAKLMLFGGRVKNEEYDGATGKDTLLHSTGLSTVLSLEYCLY